MAETTKIEWTDHTASPWHGCTKVSPGCANCYAERQSVRNPLTLGVWGNDGTRVKSKSFIDKLRKWNSEGKAAGKPVKVFPSICDPFEDRPELVPWRQEMFAAIDECPWVTLLLLTKRPENIARMMPEYQRPGMEPIFPGMPGPLGQPQPCVVRGGVRPNVWLGTSVEDQQRADERIPRLLQVPAAVRFLSCEPLLSKVNLWPWLNDPSTYTITGRGKHKHACGDSGIHGGGGIHWVIVGGESGHGARPCHVEWIRDIVRQCKAASVPVFVKQIGAHVIIRNGSFSQWPRDGDGLLDIGDWRERRTFQGDDAHVRTSDRKGGDLSEWPEDLRVREFPQTEVVSR